MENSRIHYHIKDLTTVKHGVVAHGVNCQGKMGSGVAKAIRQKWPRVYQQFKRAPTGPKMLGQCDIIDVSEDLLIANCYTQINFGVKGTGKYASTNAINTSLKHAFLIASLYDYTIYLPRIGCGLGGLSYENDVEPIIKQLSHDFPELEVIVCDWPPKR